MPLLLRRTTRPMRILIVHNEYGAYSGEEAVVEANARLLAEHGHEVLRFTRSSGEIPGMALGRTRALLSGIYSLASRRRMSTLLRRRQPDLVHVHNLYPLISPSILGPCRRAGVPVVMTVHNYRLVCPSGLHLRRGEICQQCAGGREYWCALHNCLGSLPKSLGYAVRNAAARLLRMYRDNVTLYLCLSDFQRERLTAAGFPPRRMIVLPNMAEMVEVADDHDNDDAGQYVAFLGRLSPEKGITQLVEAARLHPAIPVKAAGRHQRMPRLASTLPPNFELLGHLTGDALESFLRRARMIVLPSTCFEGFPTVLADAMMRAKPVVCSRIGGLPEIVDDGVTGLLTAPGDAADLAAKVRHLWEDAEGCRRMGRAGREKAIREYSPPRYYGRLMAAYQEAVERSKHGG